MNENKKWPVLSIKGIKWDKWDTWEQGVQGIQGIQGEKWEQGIQWEMWPIWPKGEKWDKGENGRDGIDWETPIIDYEIIAKKLPKEDITPKIVSEIKKLNKTKDSKVTLDIKDLKGGKEILKEVSNIWKYGQISTEWRINWTKVADGNNLNLKAGTGVTLSGVPTSNGAEITITNSQSGAVWWQITGTLSDQTDLQTALNAKVNKSGDTMTGDLSVPDEVYWSGWNGSLEVPTKNALYDKIETIITSPWGSNKQVQYNDNGAFGGDADFVFDETKNAVWVQVADPLGAAHIASATGSTINDVVTGSVSLVIETLPATPAGSITQIQEPTAWSGGTASYTNGGSGTAITANGSTYDFRVYPCLYVSSTGTYYRSQFYESISAGTDPNDSQGYDISVSWWTVTISGETVYYYVEYDVNSSGSWSPLGAFSTTSETFTSLSGSNPTTAFPVYYNNTPWTPAGSPSGLSQSVINEWSGIFSGYSDGTTWYYELDSYVTIGGTKYVSGTATTSSLTDNNNGQSYDWSFSYTPWSPSEWHILRRSSDNATWTYAYIDASGSYTDYWFTNDTDAESRWGQTYSGGSVTYYFTPHGQGSAPSGNTVYSVAGSQYSTSLPADSLNYIFKHTFSGNATGKILDNNQSLYWQAYSSSTFYDVGYPTWVTGTTVTPQAYWFTGTNQNRDYKAYGFNGTIYSVVPLTLSTTSSGWTKYVSGSVAYPSGITQIKILRQINWGGYTVSKTISGTTFTDDATDNTWNGNTTVTPNSIIPATLRLDKEITSVSATTAFQLQLVSIWTWTKYSWLSAWVATDSTSTPSFQAHLYHNSSTGYWNMVTGRLELLTSIWWTAYAVLWPWVTLNNTSSSSWHFIVKGQNDTGLINTRADQNTVYFGTTASGTDPVSTVLVQPARSGDAAVVLKWHSGMSSSSVLLRTETSAGSFWAYLTVWGSFQAWPDNTTNPWHSWRSDADTWFTNPTSNEIGIVTGNSERGRFHSLGLAIGLSSSYVGQLHIKGTSSGSIQAVFDQASGQTADMIRFRNSSGTTLSSMASNGYQLALNTGGAYGGHLTIYTQGGQKNIVIKNNGTPTTFLELQNSSGTVIGQINTVWAFLTPDGSAALPSQSFNWDTNTGIYRIGADNFWFSTNWVLRFDIDTTRMLFSDGYNIAFNATTGTKIGTATSQKIWFWNATPIVQPTTSVGSATLTSPWAGTNIKSDDTFDGYTLQQVVKALRNAWLLA